MKNYALYALIFTLISTVLTLLFYFTGLQTEHLAIGLHLQWLGAIAFFIMIYLGVKEERETRPDQRMKYGSAVWGALVISLIAGLLNGAYAYVHFSYINTEFTQYMISFQVEKMTSAGFPDSVIEGAVGRMEQSFSPLRQAITAGVITVISGLVYGLMLAPGQTQRGTIKRITIVNGVIFGVLGFIFGGFNGLLSKSVGSSALIGLLAGGGCTALLTFLLLKLTNYTPRFAGEEFD